MTQNKIPLINNYLIYCFTSPSGKKYIGQTKDLNKRIKQHQYSKGCINFSNAINKYGFNNFKLDILATGLTLNSSCHFEKFYIKHFNTVSPNGYNLTSGGISYIHNEETKIKIRNNNIVRKGYWHGKTGKLNPNFGKKVSEDILAKMRLIRGEKHWAYGKKGKLCCHYGRKLTKEHKEKIGNSSRGRIISDETKQKISIANSGENSYMYGKKMPDYIKEKIRIANSGKKRTEEQNKATSERQKGENGYWYGKIGELHHSFGKKLSEETKNKISESRKGEKNHNFGKFGEYNKSSKKYIILNPNGNIEVIIGLTKYCRDSNLDQGTMNKVARGQAKSHHKYKCFHYSDEKYQELLKLYPQEQE